MSSKKKEIEDVMESSDEQVNGKKKKCLIFRICRFLVLVLILVLFAGYFLYPNIFAEYKQKIGAYIGYGIENEVVPEVVEVVASEEEVEVSVLPIEKEEQPQDEIVLVKQQDEDVQVDDLKPYLQQSFERIEENNKLIRDQINSLQAKIYFLEQELVHLKGRDSMPSLLLMVVEIERKIKQGVVFDDDLQKAKLLAKDHEKVISLLKEMELYIKERRKVKSMETLKKEFAVLVPRIYRESFQDEESFSKVKKILSEFITIRKVTNEEVGNGGEIKPILANIEYYLNSGEQDKLVRKLSELANFSSYFSLDLRTKLQNWLNDFKLVLLLENDLEQIYNYISSANVDSPKLD